MERRHARACRDAEIELLEAKLDDRDAQIASLLMLVEATSADAEKARDLARRACSEAKRPNALLRERADASDRTDEKKSV